MNNYSGGYVTDICYTNSFYKDLTPGIINMALIWQGFAPVGGDNLRYLELGYGMGTSLNVHGAAVPGEFWGTDFNPDHTVNAQSVAKEAKIDTKPLNYSFAELANSQDLPKFDMIALHGVWSWINDENRAYILEIINRNLKIGGVVYVSYNAMPGWSSIMPMRDLMVMHSKMFGAKLGNSREKASQAYTFVKSIADNNANYFKANPQAQNMLNNIAIQDLNYVVHEYFNQHLRPFYFAELCEIMSSIKLSHAGSTRLLDSVNQLLPETAQNMLSSTDDVVFKETMRDFYTNRMFRTDIFVKGGLKLSQEDRHKHIMSLPLCLTCVKSQVKYTVDLGGTQISMKEELYGKLVEALASQDYGPKTIAELIEITKLPVAEVFEAVCILCGSGSVHPAQSREKIKAASEACLRFNLTNLQGLESNAPIQTLASPVLGGGIGSNFVEMAFLQSVNASKKQPRQIAIHATSVLSRLGQNLVLDGTTLNKEDSEKHLFELAEDFIKYRLPYLQAMKII